MTLEYVNYRYLVRGGTAANLAAVNETPLHRELIVETDTGKMKLGNGSTPFNSLPYLSGGGIPDAPSDGSLYARLNGAWAVVPDPGIEEAPNDGQRYARKNEAWDVVPDPGIPDAPSDGQQYARKDGAWEVVESGGGGGSGWDSVVAWPPGSINTGWEGYTLRSFINAAVVGEGTKVRVSIKAPATGDLHIDKMFAGPAAASGDPYDFAGTPTPLLFGGSASVVIPAGTTVVSDECLVTLDGITPLVLSNYFPSTPAASIHTAGVTGWGYAYKTGDDAATVNASGYTNAGGGTGALVHKLEIWRDGGGGGGAGSRSTATLASGTGSVAVGKTALLLKIATTAAARCRFYATAAARTADSGRAAGVEAAPGAGLLLEFISTGAFLGAPLTPGIVAFNDDTTVTDLIYYNIEPVGGSMSVDLTYLKLEN